MVGSGGTCGELTVTVALTGCEVPPAPVQARVYVLVWFSAPVDLEPERPGSPDQAPEALQDVALVEAQVNVELCPAVTEVGEADRVTVGKAGGGVVVPVKLVTST